MSTASVSEKRGAISKRAAIFHFKMIIVDMGSCFENIASADIACTTTYEAARELHSNSPE
jgi:hypothetical protein